MEQSITHRRSSSRCACFDLLSAATAGSVVTSLVKNKGTSRSKLFWLNKDVNCFYLFSTRTFVMFHLSSSQWAIRGVMSPPFMSKMSKMHHSSFLDTRHVRRTHLLYLTEVCISESPAEGFAPFSLALLSILSQIYNILSTVYTKPAWEKHRGQPRLICIFLTKNVLYLEPILDPFVLKLIFLGGK